MTEQPRVDIVIPVYNSLHLVRRCVESVARHTDFELDRLTIIDDGSDAHTAAFLDRFAAGHGARLLRNDRNIGFVRTCNRAWQAAEAPYVLLLNSDTLVTPGWLNKMVRAMESDPAIGIASPISNFAPHMQIDMVPGLDYLAMSEAVERLSPREYPDITTTEGFCYLIRATCLADIGYFDAVFDDGYGEESDQSMRANAAGWRTVCVDDTYIYHHGRGTFGDESRAALYERNKEIFFDRWKDDYARDYGDMNDRQPLGTLHRRLDELRRHTPAVG